MDKRRAASAPESSDSVSVRKACNTIAKEVKDRYSASYPEVCAVAQYFVPEAAFDIAVEASDVGGAISFDNTTSIEAKLHTKLWVMEQFERQRNKIPTDIDEAEFEYHIEAYVEGRGR